MAMTDEKKKRLGEISFDIESAAQDAKRIRRELASIEERIARLDAERWQLILTN